jgi:mRNA interferase HicA
MSRAIDLKRRHLISRVHDRAKSLGKAWESERRGSRHDLFRCGGTVVTIPRHREINEMTALGIMKTLEAELGEAWWR